MPNTTKNPQPFVKWVGGKRSLLSEILSRLPESFNNYFEPFVGGGAVYFAIADKLNKAMLIDHNLELILAYQMIKKEPYRLIEKLKEHAEKHSKRYYYSIRAKNYTDPLEIVARFLYLNKTCFNGLYRVNKAGNFNTPMGSYNNPNITQEENILLCHQVLQNVNLLYGDFEKKCLPLIQRNDFVYFDPPYHPTNELSFTEYTKDNFTEKDQVRLRDSILKLHKCGAYIMLSNSKTKLIEDLYRHKCFKHHVVMAPRYVNCKPSDRHKVEEFLITNY